MRNEDLYLKDISNACRAISDFVAGISKYIAMWKKALITFLFPMFLAFCMLIAGPYLIVKSPFIDDPDWVETIYALIILILFAVGITAPLVVGYRDYQNEKQDVQHKRLRLKI